MSDEAVAEILGKHFQEIAEIKHRLSEQGVLVGYQSRINYGKTYFKMFIDSLSRKHPQAVDALTRKLWSDPSCVYMERANSKYDFEFEIILDSKSKLKPYLKDFSDYQAVVLTENLYTNLFPVNKTANLKEIRDFLIRQDGKDIDLRQSKLWYLDHQSAESYLHINENRKYFEAMSKNELELFDEIAKKLRLKYSGASFAVTDIGSGDGLKARVFIEKLGEKFVKAYYPVDIQPIELAAALKSHEGTQYAKHPTLLPIESMSARFPLSLLPDERQVYLFLGGTYGNFPLKAINADLKKILNETSTLIVSMPVLRDSKTDEEIIDSYTTPQVESLATGVLSHLGLAREQLEPNPTYPHLTVQPRMENGRLVTQLILKESVEIFGKRFNKGAAIKVTTSWKPTFEQFKAAIESDFKAEFIRNKEFAIAIIEQ